LRQARLVEKLETISGVIVSVGGRLPDGASPGAAGGDLTSRQLEIFVTLANGESTKQIAHHFAR
jgi:DNA-binding NarL/FixJ family response regulator